MVSTRLVLGYAVNALRLPSIMLRVDTHENAGFRECGRRREVLAAGGKLWDVVYMDILATEFESPVLAQILTSEEARS